MNGLSTNITVTYIVSTYYVLDPTGKEHLTPGPHVAPVPAPFGPSAPRLPSPVPRSVFLLFILNNFLQSIV